MSDSDKVQAAREKLKAKFADKIQIGGKGTVRRTVKPVAKKAGAEDDKTVVATLKKLGATPVQEIEEVNFFKADGNVINVSKPKVHAIQSANTYSVSGKVENKNIAEMLPGVINQLGMRGIQMLAGALGGAPSGQAPAGGDDDEMPNLESTNFEEVSESQ